MKISVDCYMAKRMMEDWNRDYYSVNGLDAILEYYDEVDENMEFDPIAICCDCTEYGEHGAVYSFDDLIREYDHVLDLEEWKEANGYTDEEGDYDEEAFFDELIEKLEWETTVLRVSNGNYIVFAF